jgi:hypothetical protein
MAEDGEDLEVAPAEAVVEEEEEKEDKVEATIMVHKAPPITKILITTRLHVDIPVKNGKTSHNLNITLYTGREKELKLHEPLQQCCERGIIHMMVFLSSQLKQVITKVKDLKSQIGQMPQIAHQVGNAFSRRHLNANRTTIRCYQARNVAALKAEHEEILHCWG